MILRHKEFKSCGNIILFPSSISNSSSQYEKPQFMLAANIVPVIGVHFNKSKVKLKVGQTADLYVEILPSHATELGLKWVITNVDIVETELHKNFIHLKAKKAGRTIIIATTEDGQFRDLCVVTIASYITTNK